MEIDEVRRKTVFLPEYIATDSALPGIVVTMETHVHEVECVVEVQDITVWTRKRRLCRGLFVYLDGTAADFRVNNESL